MPVLESVKMCVVVCAHLCIFRNGSDRNADGILIRWLILTTPGEMAVAAVAADLAKEGTFWHES